MKWKVVIFYFIFFFFCLFFHLFYQVSPIYISYVALVVVHVVLLMN